MGSPTSEKGHHYSDEHQHQVYVEDFYIGKYEVTFAEYDQFAEAKGRTKPYDEHWGRDDRPVINVSWNDAVAYTEWLSEQTGKVYRLPTEVEWEYAARAGTETAYWWGDEIGFGNANCDRCNSQWDNSKTAPVGSFSANKWGLYDTAGNVREWIGSGYSEDYSGAHKLLGRGVELKKLRVSRGGSWYHLPYMLRSAYRIGKNLTVSNRYMGFRLARSRLP